MHSSTHSPPFPIAITVLAIAICAASAIGADDPASRVRTIRVPAGVQPTKAQLGADGTIHLLADSPGGPQYLRSTNKGLTFSAPTPIVDRAAQKPGLKFIAWDLAVAGDGRVHVALGTNAWQLKLPKEEWGYYYNSLPPGAKAFPPVRDINRQPSEGFSLAAGPGGSVTACFLSGKLYGMVSHDAGANFTPYAEVNPAWLPCNCCTTSVAYGRDGRLALLYREATNNDRDIFLALWDQHSSAPPTHTFISTTPWKIPTCPMTYFTIAATPTGYVAAWPTKGEIYFTRLDKDGAVLSPGEIKTAETSGMRTGILALSAPDGATLIAAKNKDMLQWQIFDGQGQPQGSIGSAPSPGTGAAGVVLPDGKFALFP